MTAAGVVVYAVAIAIPLAAAARLMELGMTRAGLPTRGIWVASLTLCVALPLVAALRAASVSSFADGEERDAGLVAWEDAAVVAGGAGAPSVPDRVASGLGALQTRLDRGLASAAAALADAPLHLGRWIAVAWCAASLMLAVTLLVSASRLSRRAEAWPREVLQGRVARVAPDLGPATFGLLRPEIVLPRWAATLPARRLELILMHEEEHVRARDPLLLGIGLAAIVACPLNPLLWWQRRRLRDAVEVDCDRRVLRRGAAARSYGDLLLWIGTHRHLELLPATTMSGSKSLLERRLTAMKAMTTTRLGAALPRMTGAAVLACGLLIVACTTEPPVAGEGPSASEAVVERNPLVADVWVEPDGRVYINDRPYPMEVVSEALLALDARTAGDLVVSLQADPAAPYGVMDDLQQELRASGMVRVVFATRTEPRRTPPGQLSEVLEGLALVLPDAGMAVPVSGRNLLHLEVEPSGIVEVRRGTSPEVERLRAAGVEALWRREVASNPRLIAAVKVRRDASYTQMTEVLDALHAAEAQRISIQTLAEPGP